VLLRSLADRCFAQGVGLLDDGSPGTAYTLLALAAWLAPGNCDVLLHAAKAASALGRRDEATRYCERALLIDPSSAALHELLMRTFLHGDDYFQVLKRIHAVVGPRAYLEIGVEQGHSIRLAGAETLAIGVDPAPRISGALPPNVRIFPQTSDEFFARGDVRALLEGRPLDLAFIDGMHHFEVALRDFMHLEQLSARGSTILIHDCFPHDRATAERERHGTAWTGDVWKLIVLLKKYRPDLSIHTVATPPSGLAIVRNLDPASRFIADNLERLSREFLELDYSFLDKDRAGKLNLLPNDWNRVQALLEQAVAPQDALHRHP
jgi:Methyltransferase domain